MITIINQGQKPENIRFKTDCPKCGCTFTYQESDTDYIHTYDSSNIKCPNCTKALPHSLDNIYRPVATSLPRQVLDVKADIGTRRT